MVNFCWETIVNGLILAEKMLIFLPVLYHREFLMHPNDVLMMPLLQHDVRREDVLRVMQQGGNDELEVTTLRRL